MFKADYRRPSQTALQKRHVTSAKATIKGLTSQHKLVVKKRIVNLTAFGFRTLHVFLNCKGLLYSLVLDKHTT